jgi:hypothetical protein
MRRRRNTVTYSQYLIDSHLLELKTRLLIDFLVSRGYTDPYLTDGWRDGGTDCRFVTIPSNPANIAIQISIEKDWRSKLWQDVRKVKATYGYDRFILISSRIIPESDLQRNNPPNSRTRHEGYG